jgi:hypothetical protein
MTYTPEQRQVIGAIKRIGQRRGVPRKYIKAALEIGKVESNFRNLSYGDADSQGWRQERASLYKNPTNLKASINRVYNEMAQHDRGQRAGLLAADVQRPAAQYRGRYTQVSGEAKALLGGGKLKAPSGLGVSTGGTVKFRLPGTDDRTTTDTKAAVVDALLHHKGGSLLKAVTANIDSGQYTKTVKGVPAKTITSKLADGLQSDGGSAPKSSHGTSEFEGKQVAAWMVPALQFARAHGWKGHVTSGVRTRSQQAQLYRNRANNPYPVAKPGSSNHEIENGGAIDVSDYSTLAKIMSRYGGKKLVQGTAINDPVHFSATGH